MLQIQSLGAATGTLLLSGALCSGAAHAATIYDAALGRLPSAQSWTTLAAGTGAAESVGDGRYHLDTGAATLAAFGNGIVSPVALDTAAGFDLSFTLQVTSEAHVSSNRSGYSVLFVGADPSKALELAFWSNSVWAYDYDAADPDRLVHGATAGLYTAVLRNYTLSVRNQKYSVLVGGDVLLSGNLHDYTAAGLPYTLPNFIFFGDDSSRGVSISDLALVTVTVVPEPAAAALLLAGLGLLGAVGQAGRQRGVGLGWPWPSMAT